VNIRRIPGRFLLRRPARPVALAATVALLLAGCQGAPAPTPTTSRPNLAVATAAAPVATATATATTAAPVTAPSATPSSPPFGTPVPAPSPTQPPTATAQPAGTGVVVTIGPDSVARYLVREQFARLNLPNDAVGVTSEVSGAVVLDAAGRVVSAESKITVNSRSLRSDESDRDDYLRTDGLETDKFQQIKLVVESAPGLPWPLPKDGEAQFQLQGSMTAHGVTSPITWEVTAKFTASGAQGQAKTNFPFAKFGMKRPSAFFLLSVEDNIRLELDFVATVQPRT
jgi:polyisoprenoid-binding protein YceI